jgi:hypothetical protein
MLLMAILRIRSEVITLVKIKIVIFWSEENRVVSTTLNIEAVGMMTTYETTWRHNPEDHNPNLQNISVIYFRFTAFGA